MSPYEFQLHISPEAYLDYYRGTILKTALGPTQRRKGAKTQGFRLLGTIARWASHFPSSSSCPLRPCLLGLCVNCRFSAAGSPT
jgi:hypothetical protein